LDGGSENGGVALCDSQRVSGLGGIARAHGSTAVGDLLGQRDQSFFVVVHKEPPCKMVVSSDKLILP
jgi:hypothetical protein